MIMLWKTDIPRHHGDIIWVCEDVPKPPNLEYPVFLERTRFLLLGLLFSGSSKP